VYFNLLRTLFSFKKRDNYPMYSMTYYGDYEFDEFIKEGAKSDDDIRKFVRKRLTRRKDVELNKSDSGCTAFLTKSLSDGILFARNFDFSFAPSLIVKTKPRNGYASVSIVDMTILGYKKDNMPKKTAEKLPLLASPYLPSDGMNEKGLAVAILQVPQTNLPKDPNKVMLNTTTIIRLLLDKAATVDEAVNLFNQYNLYFSHDIYCHYFIADQTGKSVILEFLDGKVYSIEENIASNFCAKNGFSGNISDCAHDRYDKVKSTLGIQNGLRGMTDAASLLCNVGCYNKEKIDMLQWSVVYNLTMLKGMAFPHRNMSKPYRFRI